MSFDAYVEDEVPDISEEKYRIRRYKIYFYPEDDTIQVNEPELKNSGLPQGIYSKWSYTYFISNSCLYTLSLSSFLKDPVLLLGIKLVGDGENKDAVSL